MIHSSKDRKSPYCSSCTLRTLRRVKYLSNQCLWSYVVYSMDPYSLFKTNMALLQWSFIGYLKSTERQHFYQSMKEDTREWNPRGYCSREWSEGVVIVMRRWVDLPPLLQEFNLLFIHFIFIILSQSLFSLPSLAPTDGKTEPQNRLVAWDPHVEWEKLWHWVVTGTLELSC